MITVLTVGMNYFLKHIKIGTRVGIGFLIILSIFIVAAIYGIDAFKRFEKAFNYYAKKSNKTVEVLNASRQVSELQRTILTYSYTGNLSVANRSKELYAELVNNIELIKEGLKSSGDIAILNSMEKILVQYGKNIDNLVELKQRRDYLTKTSMREISSNTEVLIKKIYSVEDFQEELEKVLLINEHILRAELDTATFLNTREFYLKKSIKESLVKAKQYINELIHLEKSSSLNKRLLNELKDNITLHENIFYKAIQATRDYLFLVNVVMAGEAREFSTLSDNLRKSTIISLNELTLSTQKQASEMRKSTLILVLALIILSVLLAYIINRSLLLPIEGITKTFEKLAREEKNIDIPGLERGDEIGQLAGAANVFKETNDRTQLILKESQEIASKLTLREKELKEHSELLQKSNDELDNFAYIASHDLKSPLRAIDNLCQWISEDCEAILPEESQEHLTKMRQRIIRMENLLSDLLDYSRVGRLDDIVETVDIQQLVKELSNFIDKPESFTVNVDSNLPTITTQVTPLRQVFLNLLTNAVKYREKDSGRVVISCRELNDDLIEFSVTDDGPGIEARYHERIFQMFQTLHSRDVIESSGMGLAIIKKVVESQGGEISIDSGLGKGAIFTFSWPSHMTKTHEAE